MIQFLVRFLIAGVVCLGCTETICAQHRVQLHPTGAVSQNQLVQLLENEVQFADGAKIAWEDLYRYGKLRERANRSWVVLSHGEVIVADRLELRPDGLTIQSLLWKPVVVSWQDVRAVIRNVPKVLSARDRLLESVFHHQAEEFVIFNDQTRLDASCSIDKEGRIVLEQTSLGKEFVIPFSSVKACVFNGLVRSDTARAMIGFSDGSFGLTDNVSRQGSELVWNTSTGITFQTAAPLFLLEEFNAWDHLEFLQPIRSDVVYLDEVESAQTVALPFFEGELGNELFESTRVQPERDGRGRNALGGWLRSNDSLALHGIGMTALSRKTFKVPDGASLFVSDIAVDSRALRHGSVTFHLFLRSGSGEWRSVHSSGVLRGGDPSLSIQVQLQGATELSLVVGMADRATVADYANWLDARFVIDRSKLE